MTEVSCGMFGCQSKVVVQALLYMTKDSDGQSDLKLRPQPPDGWKWDLDLEQHVCPDHRPRLSREEP